MSEQDFGCATCWPEDADQAWAAQTLLPRVQQLVQESHFIVATRRCAACSQSFLWIFTEIVDFSRGDDAQYSTIIPLTAEELSALDAAGHPPAEDTLSAVGPGRRSLWRNYPSGGALACSWSTGVGLLMHD